MNEHLAELMRRATRLTQGGKLAAATQALQQVLARQSAAATTAAPAPLVWRDGAFEPAAPPAQTVPPPAEGAGRFDSGRHEHGGLGRDYKLFIPAAAGTRALPLLVMLHGCTQDPDDFAAGTGMNALARSGAFFVLYPAQAAEANPQRCWNWFKHSHQRRGSGEPGLIADLTRQLVRQHGIDASRVYIAGLSAGGAMAATVAALHPELYAALGVHSGLPSGAAQDLSGALTAMRGGGSAGHAAALPTIVFHGDRDATVHPRNGDALIEAALRAAGAPGAAVDVHEGVAAGGGRYTRMRYGAPGRPTLAEHWRLHGAGHAWSGGHSAGSYTDPAGPDASAEMLRFFLQAAPRR